jgi:hypothetical protein
MTFNFEKMILWFHAGGKRELSFEPNKVNVITGESNTGKSAILQIIDYCLFSKHSKISESIINENVSWYGITMNINEKKYTICRSSLSEGEVTYDYFFSSSGKIPELPETNCDEKTIKSVLETEFGIDHNIQIPFGGKVLQTGSKISLRFFLLFTTISENIITHNNVFFDKQHELRYREALERVFDIAVGIDNINNILKKEKKLNLESEIKKLERIQNRELSQKNDFLKEIEDIIKRAKEYGLIAADLKVEDAISTLKRVLMNFSATIADSTPDEYSKLKNKVYQYNITIRNLKRLRDGYNEYKNSLKNVEDSLKPIIFLHSKKVELIKTSIFEGMIHALESDLKSIKRDVKKQTPIDINVSDLIHDYERKILDISKKIAALPQDVKSFNSDREKHFFMGELNAKIKLYSEQTESITSKFQTSIKKLQDELSHLQIIDDREKREMFIKFLEEIIQTYMKLYSSVLENYKDYLPVFDYTKKALLLRKPFTDFIENVGSSSNHMFLHLFLFLGLHEAIQRKNVPFVPPYLIIDQPSRPYWGEGENKKERLDHGDEAKIRKAFELLDHFVDNMINKLQKSCQLIIFEHVPPVTWKGLEHVHLVEEFINGNALIPKTIYEKK